MKALCSFETPGICYPLMQCHVPEEEKISQPLNNENLETSKLQFVQRQKPRDYKARHHEKWTSYAFSEKWRFCFITSFHPVSTLLNFQLAL